MILVLDAYGRIGSVVVRHLTSMGQQVRAFVPTRSRLFQLDSTGAELVIGAMDDPSALYTAMLGIDTVVLVSPQTPGEVALEQRAIDAAIKADVKRIVKLSSVDADAQASSALARAHRQVEQRLEQIDVPSIVVRSSRLMQILELQVPLLVHAGIITGCQGDAAVADVDARDVAAVLATLAAHGLRRHPSESHQLGSVTYVMLTGPQALTRTEMAEVLSGSFGRFIGYIDCTPAELLQYAQAAGINAQEALDIVAFESVARDGRFSITTDAGRVILGRPLRDFASFANELAVSVRFSRSPSAVDAPIVSQSHTRKRESTAIH